VFETRYSGAMLTEQQKRIQAFIEHSVDSRGVPPSMREICDNTGLSSTSSVSHQLNQLERAGYIKRDPGTARTLEVIQRLTPEPDAPVTPLVPVADNMVPVPLVGRIAAVCRSPQKSRSKTSCPCRHKWSAQETSSC